MTLTPRSRAASHISSVLMAAGSPMGSSSTSTIRGSMLTMSGEISISCRSMPSGIASSFWSWARKVMVYASMFAFAR